jgi:hypothetical protein
MDAILAGPQPIGAALAGVAAMDLFRVTNYFEIDPASLNARDHNMATRVTGPLSYSGFLGDD